jgi:heat shock protein 5
MACKLSTNGCDRRLIGRKFDDKATQKDLKHLPFKVVDKNGQPWVKVDDQGTTKELSPEQISAMVLGKMKEIAESYLGEKVTNAGKHRTYWRALTSRSRS